MSGQLRVPAGQEGGGRFASRECPSTYRLLAAARVREPAEERMAGWATDADNPQRTLVPAARCPHGHFARWAAAHCRPCQR